MNNSDAFAEERDLAPRMFACMHIYAHVHTLTHIYIFILAPGQK